MISCVGMGLLYEPSLVSTRFKLPAHFLLPGRRPQLAALLRVLAMLQNFCGYLYEKGHL